MDNLIMIVDDAKFARTLLKRALSNGGYDSIIEASSAAEAITLFTERTPDLTILDITLPDNTDLTLLQKLLSIRPTAKIIVNSAIGQALIISDALEMGAKNFVTKPFDEMELINIVNAVIEND